MALQAIFQPAEKTRVFLQYDPARGYDLAEVGRQVRLYEIGDQLAALPQGGGRRGGAAAEAGAAPDAAGGRGAPPAMKPEDQQKLQAIQQQLVSMFRNY